MSRERRNGRPTARLACQLLVAAAAIVIGIAVASRIGFGTTGGTVDQRVLDCGASTPGNEVLTVIELPRARDFWKRLPAAAGAPELENDQPALLVVFKGDYTWFRTGQVYRNVVCVYQDGYPHIYPNVDLRGANLQP
ncbi:MAG: hypothetical protein C4343_05595 [Chloroflexota bacterium]